MVSSGSIDFEPSARALTDFDTGRTNQSGGFDYLARWPILGAGEAEMVEQVLRSGSLLKSGEQVRLLEEEWSGYSGSQYTIATSSCTHSIHAALAVLDLKLRARVGVPALGFIGTVHPILHAGYTPVFLDVLPGSFNLDPRLIEGARLDALVAVHLHGLPCNMTEITQLTRKLGIRLIEDACQAHGATWNRQMVGTFGDIACFSLNEVKNLPAGQGGLLTTNSTVYHQRLRDLCGYGRQSGDYYLTLGHSFGLSEIPAAIARSQLRDLGGRLLQVEQNAAKLSGVIGKFAGLRAPAVDAAARHTWHKYRVACDDTRWQPKALVERLNRAGVPAGFWARYLLPDHPVYNQNGPAEFVETGVAREAVRRTFFIGTELYSLIAQNSLQVQRMCDRLEAELDSYDEIAH